MVSKKGPSRSKRTSRRSVAKSSSNSSTTVISLLKKIEQQQKLILANQRKEAVEIRASGEKIEEEIIEAETNAPGMNEEKEIAEIKRLEEDLKKGAQEPSALRRITYRDVTRGLVGAFIAVVNQFAFADGFNIASSYSIFQSTLLFITSFFIIVLFIYYTGFRKIDDRFVFKFLPIRAGVLYLVSIIVSALVPFIFNTLTPSMPFSVIYGTIASISVLAVLGAGTADLIGKN